MREKLDIPEEHIRTCLQEEYGLTAVRLDFLPLGLDTRAGIYRVVSEQGSSYLLKAKWGALYEPGCLVPRYLRDQGIMAVVAPMPTKTHALWTQVADWVVIVYPFIEGNASWTGMTDGHWKETGAVFKQIHQATLPPSGFASLRRETFDPAEYVNRVQAFEAQYLHAQRDGRASERAVCSSWITHQPAIHAALAVLDKLAAALRERSGPYVICHADLHQNNLLRDCGGHVFVIDWDDVMLAPKERDFIFVGDAPADSAAWQDAPAFWQGYGETEIDWIALTYYRYERIVQDVIECARNVFFREDLGEETRANEARLFDKIFSGGGVLDAAYAAETHIPSDPIFHNRQAAR